MKRACLPLLLALGCSPPPDPRPVTLGDAVQREIQRQIESATIGPQIMGLLNTNDHFIRLEWELQALQHRVDSLELELFLRKLYPTNTTSKPPSEP